METISFPLKIEKELNEKISMMAILKGQNKHQYIIGVLNEMTKDIPIETLRQIAQKEV